MADPDWKRASMELLQADDAAGLARRENEGTLGMPITLACRYAAQSESLRCLRWAYMRAGVSRNELLPFTTHWPEGRRWLLEH